MRHDDVTTDTNSSPKPLEHQIPILAQLAKDREKGKTIIVIPSGAGKTHIAAFDSLNLGAKSVLYIAHRQEILNQAAEIFQRVHGIDKGKIGFVTKDDDRIDSDFVFGTNISLSKEKNISRLAARGKEKQIDYMVIDEYHHVAAPTYQMILEYVEAKFTLGLTATPFRHDNKNIMNIVDDNISAYIDIPRGLEKGIIVPFQYNGLYDDVDYSDIHWNGIRYKESDLDKKLVIKKRDEQIVQEYLKYIGRGKPTMGFCVSVKHCERITEVFKNHDIKAEYVTYLTPSEKRSEIEQNFRDGKIDVMFSRDVFGEGVDFPITEGLLFLRPTFSKVVFMQQLGRGLRKNEGKGKTHVTVLDFVGNYPTAFMREDWLGFAEESPIELLHKPKKPEYDHTVARVHFDRRLIHIFEKLKLLRIQASTTEGAAMKLHLKRDRVIQMHEEEGKTYREICQELRISPTDVSNILHEYYGTEKTTPSKNKDLSIETQALHMFNQGSSPIDVAIALNISSDDVIEFYRKYWELKQLPETMKDRINK